MTINREKGKRFYTDRVNGRRNYYEDTGSDCLTEICVVASSIFLSR